MEEERRGRVPKAKANPPCVPPPPRLRRPLFPSERRGGKGGRTLGRAEKELFFHISRRGPFERLQITQCERVSQGRGEKLDIFEELLIQ